MLKKKKTTASDKLVLVKSVRRTRSHRMKFCVQRGLGTLPSTSKRRGKSRRDFVLCESDISCQENGKLHSMTALNNALTKLCSRSGLPHLTVHGFNGTWLAAYVCNHFDRDGSTAY